MISNAFSGLSRRQFLGGCAACAALAGCNATAGSLLPLAAQQRPDLPAVPSQKAKIRLVYVDTVHRCQAVVHQTEAI